jgi:hypothetical protein
MIPLANNFLFLPMTLLSTYLYKNKKRHHVMIVGCIIQLIGCWFRSVGYFTDSFWPIVVGQWINQVAQAIYGVAISIVANVWFPSHQRNIATSISAMATVGGSIVTLGITGLICTG